MTDAAEVTEATTEESSQIETAEHVPGVDPDPEMPDFDIYQKEEGDESQNEISKFEPESAEEEPKEQQEEKKPQPDTTWSERVKKDRQLRKREIEFKRREQFLAEKEKSLQGLSNAREALLRDPNAFLEKQGINPLEFYTDWTNRLATGVDKPSENLRLTATEQEVKTLKEELMRRDQMHAQQRVQQEQQKSIENYYQKIEDFRQTTEEFPLTKEQCTAPDIAQGIAQYYEKTGIELSFKEAFKLVENGLQQKETDIFNDPSIVAKFREYHGLEASKKKGRGANLTLSSNLQTQPTKTPAEDMSDDEIYEFWKGKLFT